VQTISGGPAEIDETLNGAPVVVIIPAGSTASVAETSSGGSLIGLAVTQTAGTNPVTVNGASAPQANDDEASASYGVPLTGNVMSNDLNLAGNSVSLTSVTFNGATTSLGGSQVSVSMPFGTLTIGPDGSYSYSLDPKSGFQCGSQDIAAYTIGDSYGRTSSANLTVDLPCPDTTAPTDGPVVTGTLGNNGWYRSDVSVAWHWTDEAGGSGIDTAHCTQSSGSGGAEGAAVPVSSSCRDLAGNLVSDSLSFKIDKTAPAVSVTGVTATQYLLGAVPAAGCTSSDPGGSGIATAASVQVTTTGSNSVGSFTATCGGAVDKAGNPQAAPVSVTYTVVYGFGGFVSPLPKSTLQKSGSAIPVKFVLTNASGTPIGASLAAALAAAGKVEATLAGPGINPQVVLCGWNTVGLYFQCNIKTPSGLKTGSGNQYTITASENVGGDFVTAPKVGSAVNPETVYFK
jgi:hypothetical protein